MSVEQTNRDRLNDKMLGQLLNCPRVQSLRHRVEVSPHPAIIIWTLLQTGNPWARAAAILLLKEWVAMMTGNGHGMEAQEFVAWLRENDYLAKWSEGRLKS